MRVENAIRWLTQSISEIVNAADDLGAQGLARARAHIHVPPTSTDLWPLSRHEFGKILQFGGGRPRILVTHGQILGDDSAIIEG